MPHRIAGHYAYTFLASGGVILSFLASVKQTVAEQAPRVMLAVGEAPDGSLSPVMMSWLAFAGSAFVVFGKAYVDYRVKKRQADIEDAEAFGPVIVQARKELGDAKAELGTAKARIADLEATNRSQAAEMAVMQAKLAAVADSQKQVVKAVNKRSSQVKDVAKRVGELEHVMGSSSNLDLPATPAEPPQEDTTLDMPNLP